MDEPAGTVGSSGLRACLWVPCDGELGRVSGGEVSPQHRLAVHIVWASSGWWEPGAPGTPSLPRGLSSTFV